MNTKVKNTTTKVKAMGKKTQGAMPADFSSPHCVLTKEFSGK